jgi:hypothetical protein
MERKRRLMDDIPQVIELLSSIEMTLYIILFVLAFIAGLLTWGRR